MATPEHFLWHARQAEASGSSADFLSAVIVDEKSVWDYNRGVTSRDGVVRTTGKRPSDPLVPIYPHDGTYTADNPATLLTGDWVNSAENAASADFIRFAQTAQGQAVVRAAGYRDQLRTLDDDVAQTGRLSAVGTTAQLSVTTDVLLAAQQTFPEVRKRADVLFLLDVSGSMDEMISSSDTRLSQAKSAIAAALDHFMPGDEVGLAGFAQNFDGVLVPGEVAPVAEIRQNGESLRAALHQISSMGDTPLYEAVDTFAKQQATSWSPDRINAIVLLSDGEDDTNHDTTTAEQMLATLAQLRQDTPVLIFTIAYGEEADIDALRSISTATGAHYYRATDPTKLQEVLRDLMTNF